jgi:hypothetical protein
MAKPAAKPTNSHQPTGILQPQATDPKLELYYLLGVLRGAGVDNAVRVAELVNQLLAPATPAAEGD